MPGILVRVCYVHLNLSKLPRKKYKLNLNTFVCLKSEYILQYTALLKVMSE